MSEDAKKCLRSTAKLSETNWYCLRPAANFLRPAPIVWDLLPTVWAVLPEICHQLSETYSQLSEACCRLLWPATNFLRLADNSLWISINCLQWLGPATNCMHCCEPVEACCSLHGVCKKLRPAANCLRHAGNWGAGLRSRIYLFQLWLWFLKSCGSGSDYSL
jgi:hypothetical protein